MIEVWADKKQRATQCLQRRFEGPLFGRRAADGLVVSADDLVEEIESSAKMPTTVSSPAAAPSP